MPNKNVASLAIGRLAGKNAGVPPEKIGRLSIVSYLMGNPVLAIVAARSMVPKGDEEPVVNGNEKPGSASTEEDIKAVAAAAAAAQLAKTQAETARDNAEIFAKRAEDAAIKAENTAAKPK